MTGNFLTSISVRTSGWYTWKAVIQGQPDEHIMNWRGASYKFLIVKGSPPGGFPRETDALDFIDSLTDAQIERELARALGSKGSSITEDTDQAMRNWIKDTRMVGRDTNGNRI